MVSQLSLQRAQPKFSTAVRGARASALQVQKGGSWGLVEPLSWESMEQQAVWTGFPGILLNENGTHLRETAATLFELIKIQEHT